MRTDLGELVRALSGWILCVDECDGRCTICVELPDEELKDLDDSRKLYVALYVAARKILDYRLAAAMHIHFVRTKSVVEPRLLVRALSGAKILSAVPPAIEDDNPYVWEAVKWKGIAYAQMVLSSQRRRVRPDADSEDTFSLFLSLP